MWENKRGRYRAASGRKAESDVHVIAVPTSITDQFREVTVASSVHKC